MVKALSSMMPLGTLAPQFSLPDVISGRHVTLKHDSNTVATIIMFICNHCPFVKHVNRELTKLALDYMPKNVRFIAINSNDVDKYPADSPENMKKTAEEEKYPFPYLFDETQEVAKAYEAACTPDFFIFDKHLKLVYRGQLDDSRPGNHIPVTGDSIRDSLDAILDNQSIPIAQKPSMGCNIKWKND